jgi:hypothetical protein
VEGEVGGMGTSSDDLSRRSSRSTPRYAYLRNWRFFLSSAAWIASCSASSAMIVDGDESGQWNLRCL